MKTILVYKHKGTKLDGSTKELMRRLVETLRAQGVKFERSRKESIVVGNTKILFYDASWRNERSFLRRHKQIDVAFYTYEILYRNREESDCLVEKTFLSNQPSSSLVLSPNYDKAFLQLTSHIEELHTRPMYHWDVPRGHVSLVKVPVGCNPLYHFPVSEREDLKTAMRNQKEQQIQKMNQLQAEVEKMKECVKKTEENIAELEGHEEEEKR